MRKITFMIRRNPNTIVLYWAMQTGILVSFALLGVFSGLPSWIATVSFTLLSLDLCMFFSNPKFFEFYQKLPRRSSNSPSDLFSAENSQDITSVTDRFVPHYRPILCLVAFMAFMQWMGYNFLYAEFWGTVAIIVLAYFIVCLHEIRSFKYHEGIRRMNAVQTTMYLKQNE